MIKKLLLIFFFKGSLRKSSASDYCFFVLNYMSLYQVHHLFTLEASSKRIIAVEGFNLGEFLILMKKGY